MRACLVRNVEKPLIHYAFGVVFRFNAGYAGNDFMEQSVGFLGLLVVGECAPFGFYNCPGIDFHSSHHGFSDNLSYTVAEKKQVLQDSGLFPYLVCDRSAKRHL